MVQFNGIDSKRYQPQKCAKLTKKKEKLIADRFPQILCILFILVKKDS